MKKNVLRFSIAICMLFVCAFSINAQKAGTYAITNARIVTVSGATIERGGVIIRDGLIQLVGANVQIPADAQVIDATGLTIYPGFFDANSSVGIPAPQQQQRGGGGGGQLQALLAAQQQAPPTNSNYPAGLQPETSAIEELRSNDASITTARNNGFTTVLTVPRERIFNGQSALINTAGENVSEMLLRAPVAMHISFNTIPGTYPGSLLGTFSALRQIMLDARRLQEWKKVYDKNPRGVKRPELDKSLEALFPVLNREMPVVFNANSEIEIIRALDLAKEFNLNAMIAGGQGAGNITDRLKAQNVPVLLSLNFPRRTAASSPDADPESLETLRFRVDALKTAARLKQAGVKFAFQSGGMTNLNDFYANANRTTENGLSKDDAVRAMTLDAAQLFGVADRLGTIENGKIANLVVVRGDLLGREKAITHVFVDGKLYEQRPPAPGMGAGPGRRPGAPNATVPGAALPNVGGVWAITIEIPGQAIQGTLNFTQQGENLSGTLQSSLGTAPIRNGKVTTDGFSFSATVEYAGSTIEVNVTGKVTGNQVGGTFSTPQGPIPFSGTKNP